VPEENAEVVRKLYEAVESADFATALQLFDEKVEWSPAEGTTYNGLEGVGGHFIQWMEAWDEHSAEVREATAEGDQVLAVVHITARGEHSGLEIDQDFFQVFTIRDGKIARMVEFMDREPAAEAARLK
jgi:uncharacterized protein